MAHTETYDDLSVSIRGAEFDSRTLAGLTFFVMATQFLTVIMVAAAMVPGYDFRGAAISDLGVFPETAALFNASLVLFGVLNLAGGYLFYRTHRTRWLFGLFAVTGVAGVGTGVFPLDTGGLHGLFALLAFLFLNLQAIGTAARVSGVMRILAVVAGLVGLVFVVLMFVGDTGNAAAFGVFGHGGTERMIVYPAMLWLVAFGGNLLVPGRDTDARTAPVE